MPKLPPKVKLCPITLDRKFIIYDFQVMVFGQAR